MPPSTDMSFPRDDAYLREQYLKWWLFRSGWRRWLWLLSVLLALIALGVAFFAESANLRLSAVVVTAAGLVQGLLPWLEFRRWKTMARGGLATMPDLRLWVQDGALSFGAGPNVRYAASGDVVRVPGGCFVYEQGRTGRHVYLPERWLRDPRLQGWRQAPARAG